MVSFFAIPIHKKAGEPGLPSTLVADIELDFSRDSDRYDNLSVARDFAFVDIVGKTYLAFPSGTSHTIAIVDFDNFNVRKVTLTEAVFENTAPHGRYRGVEWAVGTPYVWTNDSTEDEHYVVDVINAKVVNTIRDVDRSTLVSVQNWARVREAEEREKMMTEIKTMQVSATVVRCARCSPLYNYKHLIMYTGTGHPKAGAGHSRHCNRPGEGTRGGYKRGHPKTSTP